MNPKIVKKEAFQVLGKAIRTKNVEGQNNQDIPKFWQDINTDGTSQKLMTLMSKPQGMFGICVDVLPDEADPNVFEYIAGIQYAGGDQAEFDLFDIPATQWAIFPCNGPMPHSIQKVWMEIFSDWLPNNAEYTLAPLPQIEFYPPGNIAPNDPNYYSEVWIPVSKK
jgi:AraC family transcriptional regulator